jgi:hypothetical protein
MFALVVIVQPAGAVKVAPAGVVRGASTVSVWAAAARLKPAQTNATIGHAFQCFFIGWLGCLLVYLP